MESIISILEIFGLMALGIVLYALVTVWKKIKTDGFSGRKFFNSNKYFWLICIALGLILSITMFIVPEVDKILNGLGFAINENNPMGHVLLGIALATGSDKTKMTGNKQLNKSE